MSLRILKRVVFFLVLLMACSRAWSLPHYELAYRFGMLAGWMMPDGKVEEWIGNRPLLGGEMNVEFLPTGRWHCLQQWNNASIGVGATYLNLSNDAKLGSAFAAYAYINEPFYNGRHFRIGVRPTVGIAACNKTYRNTFEGEHLYNGHQGANWSIGSILNAYVAVQMYMDFPVKNGWDITSNIGWHHISNGSVIHPNAGYNMFFGGIGLRYHPENQGIRRNASAEQKALFAKYEPPEPDVPKKLYEGVDKPWAVELSATGALRQTYYSDNHAGMLFFAGASIKAAAYWIPVGIFRIGGGLDAFYDGYYKCYSYKLLKTGNERPITYFGKTYLKESNIANCFRLGMSIQPEFLIGNLSIGIHVGFYLYDPIKNLEPFDEAQAAEEAGRPLNRGIFYKYDFTKASNDADGWCYMQFILKYHVLDHMFVQIGMKTHGVRAEFLDAGLGIAF